MKSMAALFDLQKPTVRTDAKAAIVSKCPFRAKRGLSLVSQVLVHESKFLTVSEQVGTIAARELCEAYIACFPSELQDELNIVGAEDKVKKKPGFLEWTEFADWVNEKAQLVQDAQDGVLPVQVLGLLEVDVNRAGQVGLGEQRVVREAAADAVGAADGEGLG